MNRSWGADPPARGVYAYSCAGDSAPVEPTAAAVPIVTAHQGLADELAPMVDLWQRLLAEHRPDQNGRCRTCTVGGTGMPGTPWPCALYGIAELAQRRHQPAPGG